MGSIILLALAAAVYPQLLAVVLIILTRPKPKPLLWACYLASLVVSVGSGVLIFTAFQSRGSVAGTSSHRVGPAAYLTAGAIAVFIAVLMLRRGQDLLDHDRSRSGRLRPGEQRASAVVARTRARAARSLSEGSLVVAGLVGAVLAVPGPFDLLALGRLARGGYGVIAAAGVIVVFALIKFVLIELPIASYAIDPDGTAARVGRFSGWMHSNKRVVVAAIVALFGAVLIGRGVSGLV